MKADEVSIAARNDLLIKTYGTLSADKLGRERLHEVSQGMRQLSRLLIQLRKDSTDESKIGLADFLKPELFDSIVNSVKTLCSFDNSGRGQSVGIPSLALKLGYSLKKCIAILKGKALREKDNSLLQDQENFEKLMDAEWSDRISHHSLTTLHGRKFNSVDLLPLTEDLETLRNHLLNKMNEYVKALTEYPSLRTWGELAEITLCRVIIFNKRRGGEASKMLVSSFANRPHWQQQSTAEIQRSLQPIEKELCKRYSNCIIEVSALSVYANCTLMSQNSIPKTESGQFI